MRKIAIVVSLLMASAFSATVSSDYLGTNVGGINGKFIKTNKPVLRWLLLTSKESAPVSANLVNGEAVVYLDGSTGTGNLKVIMKDVSGNLRTGKITIE